MPLSASKSFLIGPIRQLVTMRDLADKGPLHDDDLEIITEGALVVSDGMIKSIGTFKELSKMTTVRDDRPAGVVMPGFIDSHTHVCFGGSRAHDYSMRIGGRTYQEILKAGGGIYDTVRATRNSTEEQLAASAISRLNSHLQEGVTTCEVKSGYGLSVEEEIKMLRAIRNAAERFSGSIVPTCLAAHVPGKEFNSAVEYLEHMAQNLLPLLLEQNLTRRIDVFVEPEAFPAPEASKYLSKAKEMGFELTVHADQFTTGGSALANQLGALSADHLEASGEQEWRALAKGNTTATVLPGASLGLGMNMAPARKLLNAGCRLAIASDWNPGSAPMGDLLIQAALLSAYEKLSHAETFAGITTRAARALGLSDRGMISEGMRADLVSFDTPDYREILYHQGKLKPNRIWTNGNEVIPTIR